MLVNGSEVGHIEPPPHSKKQHRHENHNLNSDYYMFSVLSYGTETWTYSKAIGHRRRMLRISWTSHTTVADILQKIGVKETTMIINLENRNLSSGGHIMRSTSGHYDTLLRTIEGRREGKRGIQRPRRTWRTM